MSTPVWHTSNSRPLESFSPNSRISGIWECGLGHVWDAPICKVLKSKKSCPYCFNRKVLTGFNDVSSYPVLAQYFSPQNKTSPGKVCVSDSVTKIVWECPVCKHVWIQAPFLMSQKKHKCSSCLGVAKTHANSFKKRFPHLVNFFVDKNDAKKYYNSRDRVDLCCLRGHVFTRSLKWLGSKQFCPVCSPNGREVVSGVNDLGTLHPQLMLEWSPINSRHIGAVSEFSRYYAAWVCAKCGEEWETSVYNRTGKQKSGCPVCCFGNKSRQELEVFAVVQEMLPGVEVVSGARNIVSGFELDIYVPSLKFAIEYNGDFWHSDEQIQKTYGINSETYHTNKLNACVDTNICLLFIWEHEWVYDRNNVLKKIGKTIRLSQKSAASQTSI